MGAGEMPPCPPTAPKGLHEELIFKFKSMGISDSLLKIIKTFFDKQVLESCTEW